MSRQIGLVIASGSWQAEPYTYPDGDVDWSVTVPIPPEDNDGAYMCLVDHLSEKDARLIAAAPDLLQELTYMVNRCQGMRPDPRYPPWHDHCCRKARALIEHITGGER